MTRLRVASNNRGDWQVDICARGARTSNQGLCPKMKNRRLCRRVAFAIKQSKRLLSVLKIFYLLVNDYCFIISLCYFKENNSDFVVKYENNREHFDVRKTRDLSFNKIMVLSLLVLLDSHLA